MREMVFFSILIILLFTVSIAGTGFSGHVPTDTKGVVTRIEVVEVELTVKDDRGKETRARVKDPSAFAVGDRVVIKDGKVSKEVRPITGGY